MESINIENLLDMNYCYRDNFYLTDNRNKELTKTIPMLLLNTTKNKKNIKMSKFPPLRHFPICKV